MAIRQIVVALFDKLNRQLSAERGRQDKKEEEQELPAGVTDAYLLFQVCVCVCVCVCVSMQAKVWNCVYMYVCFVCVSVHLHVHVI